MKAGLTLIGTFLLVMTLSFNSAHSADNSAALTAKEEALWLEIFGQDQAQAQPKQKATEDSVNLTGQWIGYYEYDKPGNQPETVFHVIIKDEEEFLMTFFEPRNHPSEYAQAAIAINPKRQGKYIAFEKSYGRSRSDIQYNLTIGYEGAIMEGTWQINENTYGRAFFYRLSLEELKNIKRQSAH